MTNQRPVCAACKHCRKPTDTFGARAVTWRCAAAEPYSSTPGHRNPLTGEEVPERVVMIPCAWQNEAGRCDLFEIGKPGSTGDVAYQNPNYLLWAARRLEQEQEQDQASLAPVFIVFAAAIVGGFVILACRAVMGIP